MNITDYRIVYYSFINTYMYLTDISNVAASSTARQILMNSLQQLCPSYQLLLQLYILGAVASQLIANQPQPDTAQYAKYTTVQQVLDEQSMTVFVISIIFRCMSLSQCDTNKVITE